MWEKKYKIIDQEVYEVLLAKSNADIRPPLKNSCSYVIRYVNFEDEQDILNVLFRYLPKKPMDICRYNDTFQYGEKTYMRVFVFKVESI